jgi:hypothetical protein
MSVGSNHFRNDLVGIETSIFGQNSWNDFESTGIATIRVLIKILEILGFFLQLNR